MIEDESICILFELTGGCCRLRVGVGDVVLVGVVGSLWIGHDVVWGGFAWLPGIFVGLVEAFGARWVCV